MTRAAMVGWSLWVCDRCREPRNQDGPEEHETPPGWASMLGGGHLCGWCAGGDRPRV